MCFFPETRLNPQILRFEVFSQTFDLSWRPYLVGSSAAASMTFFLFRPGKVCFEGGFPTNFTVDLMDASLFFTTVRLGSMTVMILHPQNLQNWRVFIPTFYPFRCRTGPSHLFGVPLRPSFPGWSSWPGVSFLAMSGFSDSRPRICFFLGLRPFGKKLEQPSQALLKAFFLNSASSGFPHQSIIWPLVWHSFWHPSRVWLRAQVCPVGSGPAGPSCIQSSGPAVLHRVPSCARSSQKGFGPRLRQSSW